MLDPSLVELLACPSDKGPLTYVADENILYNPRLQVKYRVEDDIPILLSEEAEPVPPEQAARWA